MATDLTLQKAGVVIGHWDASKWTDSGSGTLSLANIFAAEALKGLIGSPITVNVKRCCEFASDSTTCTNEKTQTAEILLKAK